MQLFKSKRAKQEEIAGPAQRIEPRRRHQSSPNVLLDVRPWPATNAATQARAVNVDQTTPSPAGTPSAGRLYAMHTVSMPHLQDPPPPYEALAIPRFQNARENDPLYCELTNTMDDILTQLDETDSLRRSDMPVETARSPSGLQRGTLIKRTYFSRVWLYSNSRLPPHLPPLKVYSPTYPLLCLAARYSLSAYDRPSLLMPADLHVGASLRHGTKAMHMHLTALDTTSTIVLAVRGTSTLSDWLTNLSPRPTAPTGFLDDAGNLAHTGFLSVARRMIAPVAAHLRILLEEDAGLRKRGKTSLLLTGHSAGGAVAALLWAHMLSQSSDVDSELKYLAGWFRRVHCVTFGAPPVTLLPLIKPVEGLGGAGDRVRGAERWSKSFFFAFVNEGDPVARADTTFARSLINLYLSSPPRGLRPKWLVPSVYLSCAGRLVLLRPVPVVVQSQHARTAGGNPVLSNISIATEEGRIEAVLTSDEQLRTVVFGDPAMHSMILYAKRIDALAVGAVTSGLD